MNSDSKALPAGWWSRPFRAFQTNLREIDAGLDVKSALDFVEGFGADAWLLNTGGIISNYPTDLPFQTRNPVLRKRPSLDLIGDAVAAAQLRGVRLLCRMDFSKIPSAVAEEHPEWCFIAPDGSIQEYNGLVSVCPNGGYYRSAALEVLTEVIDRYPVSGFFLNWFSFNEIGYDGAYCGVCHCGPCQLLFSTFEREGDAPRILPNAPGDEEYERWRRFAAECLRSLNTILRDHIHEQNADVALIRGDYADIVWHEANNAVGRELWPLATAEEVAVVKTWQPSKPVLINGVAFLDMPYRFASDEPSTLAQYVVQTISRGGNPCTYVMGTPDRIEYRGLEAAAEVVRFHRENEPVYDGLTPAADVVIVRPDPARPFDHVRRAEFEGLLLALQRAGIPVDIAAEEHLVDILEGNVLSMRLLVLGDLGHLDDKLARAVDRWVERGGALLATGSTGMRTSGHDLRAVGLTGRSSVRQGDDLRNSYVITTTDDALDGAIRGNPLALFGAYHYASAGAGTERDLIVLSRAPFGPPEKCYGNQVTSHPGRYSNEFGRGVAVTLPWTVGAASRELGLTPIADHIADTVRTLLGGHSRVTAQSSGPVDVTVGRNGLDLVVHLINLSGARRRNFDTPIALNVDLRVAGVHPDTRVECRGAAESSATPDGDGLRVTISGLADFHVVVFRGSEATPVAEP